MEAHWVSCAYRKPKWDQVERTSVFRLARKRPTEVLGLALNPSGARSTHAFRLISGLHQEFNSLDASSMQHQLISAAKLTPIGRLSEPGTTTEGWAVVPLRTHRNRASKGCRQEWDFPWQRPDPKSRAPSRQRPKQPRPPPRKPATRGKFSEVPTAVEGGLLPSSSKG